MAKTHRKKLHESLYYLMLITLIIFISGLLFLISPLLFFDNILYMYLVLIIVGIALGYFIKGFLHDLDELTHKHHAGLISVVMIVSTLNFITMLLSFTLLTEKTIYLAILSATVFTISFLIPYIHHYFKKEGR